MTNAEEAATQNTAEFGASVGIQAEQVHNSTVYMEMKDASPREKYESGVRFLDVGVPAKARALMEDAIAHEHEDGEVRFHWVLAKLSKRTYDDLDAHDREQLSHLPDFLCGYADDEWKSALEAVRELLEGWNSPGGDTETALKAIGDLRDRQRDLIFRHLDLMLTGSARDNLWNETRDAATNAQLRGGRVDRVWAYFEPDPVEARARKPAVSTVPSNQGWTFVSTLALVASAGYFGWTALASAPPWSMIIYLTALGAGYVGFRNAFEWHYRARRLRAKESAHTGWLGISATRGGVFAVRVGESFKYYFAKYAPKTWDRDVWLDATARIRAAMRDEIVDLYEESGVKIENVRWLIRYMTSDVTRRWKEGTLREYRERWRTPPATKLRCLSFAVFAPSVMGVVVMAALVDPVRGIVAAVVLLASGTAAIRLWSRVVGERRRYVDDRLEYEQVLADRQAALQRWRKKVDDKRPNETEMETWLNSDKTLLLDNALKHYKLKWRDVIAHAFLQTPAESYKRARMSGCPWRYSRYDMRLFLVTQDGVREYRTEFDFERVEARRNERNNFRFDAVSSVGVVETSERTYTLKLTLNNGPCNDIRIVDAATSHPDTDDSEGFSKINLDAAGFMPTLRILEGIAAEGKTWLQRDP